jgi:hypothetical protein
MTDTTEQAVNEILGHYFDHTYVRRKGVLYDEWMGFGDVCRIKITEEEIPAKAFRYNPPIRYLIRSLR